MEIVEIIKPKENEPISKLEFFEVENSLNNEEEERNSLKQEENESKNKHRM